MTFEQLGIVLVVIAFGLMLISPIFLMHALATRWSRLGAVKAANQLGLKMILVDSSQFLTQFSGLLPFERGRNPSVQNLMEGAWKGHEIMLLEHKSLVGTGKSRKYVWQEIVVLTGAVGRLPDFQMVPVSRFERIKHSFVDGSGISLGESTSAKNFSLAYLLTGSEPERIALVFNDQVQEYFIRHRDQHLTIQGGRLIWWIPNWRGEFSWRSAHAYPRLLADLESTLEILLKSDKAQKKDLGV